MTDLKKLIKQSIFEENKLYLLEKASDDFGYFYQNGIVYFAQISKHSDDDTSIETQFLDMNLHVHLKNISGEGYFEDGYFDLLAFKGEIDSIYFESFYNICNSYVADQQNMTFADFFNNLVDLFQLDKETSFKNLIGLIGELLFIKHIYDTKNIVISSNWHKTGARSKFDFCFNDYNIEVKTTLKSENKFMIKHNQLFNNQNNYVAVINLFETGEGYSLNLLFDYFKNCPIFSNDIKFQIKLSKELFKYPRQKERTRSFVIDDIKIYSVFSMDSISNIPSCITNLVYDYDFSDTSPIDLSEVFKN